MTRAANPDRAATPAADVWTVRRLLDWTAADLERRAVDAPTLSAQMLLGHVLGLSRIELYTHFDRPLTGEERDRFRGLVQRAREHEPVQYLVGSAGFYGLDLDVSPSVLIPRPETETLVEAALTSLKNAGRSDAELRVLDLCTGSGAIALALASHLPKATVIASDLSEDAAAVARANASKLGLSERVDVRVGDLFLAVADEPPFDLIACNPPYIPSAEVDRLDRNVRDYEPRLALDGGANGLDVIHRLLADAPAHLVAGGLLLAEMQFDQGPTLRGLAEASGDWDEVDVLKDLSRQPRVLLLRRAE